MESLTKERRENLENLMAIFQRSIVTIQKMEKAIEPQKRKAFKKEIIEFEALARVFVKQYKKEIKEMQK